MAVILSNDLRRWLDSINLDAGEWAHQDISFLGKHIYTIDIPPFRIGIGDWIGWALEIVLWGINAAIDEIWAAIRAIPSALDIVGWVSGVVDNAITNIWPTIYNAIGFAAAMAAEALSAAKQELTGAIGFASALLWEGIQNAKREVMDWTPGFVDSAIAAAFLPFRRQLNILTTFADDIVDLFKDPEDWLLKRIESMLVRFW